MSEPNITPQQAKRNMQMCYASTASSQDSTDAKERGVLLWPAQVRQVSREHTKLTNEIMYGRYYADIEKDPRSQAD